MAKQPASTDTSPSAFPTGGTSQEVGSVTFDGTVSPKEALEVLKAQPVPVLPEVVEVAPVKEGQRVSLDSYLERISGQHGKRMVHQWSAFEKHVQAEYRAGRAEMFGTVKYFEDLRQAWLQTPTVG